MGKKKVLKILLKLIKIQSQRNMDLIPPRTNQKSKLKYLMVFNKKIKTLNKCNSLKMNLFSNKMILNLLKKD